jgi:hypothetical protein
MSVVARDSEVVETGLEEEEMEAVWEGKMAAIMEVVMDLVMDLVEAEKGLEVVDKAVF